MEEDAEKTEAGQEGKLNGRVSSSAEVYITSETPDAAPSETSGKNTSKTIPFHFRTWQFWLIIGLMIAMLVGLYMDYQANIRSVAKYNLWLDSCYVPPSDIGDAGAAAINSRLFIPE